ncbi:hypothetical protein PR003_g2884 [Phytophthora rubi]|uniref:Uncharacterized protein n=1 Tax=Phytophthora rubi TaxID=129364 RepID=A0A6A4G021_9STRA|nr:hypothetical protein PF003_g4377 [Phytophthora fragariae]KAE9355360.1 hypothetical protein PR003_g2884 [Phytophthora rubi]
MMPAAERQWLRRIRSARPGARAMPRLPLLLSVMAPSLLFSAIASLLWGTRPKQLSPRRDRLSRGPSYVLGCHQLILCLVGSRALAQGPWASGGSRPSGCALDSRELLLDNGVAGGDAVLEGSPFKASTRTRTRQV